jgi:ketosteroid isomerase-like protein
MSQENVEVVRELFDAVFVRDDPARFDGGIPETIDPEIEIDWSNSKMPNNGVYGFRDAIRMLQENMDIWEVSTTDPEEIIDAGDQVVVAARLRGKGKGSGVEVDARGAQLWTLRDGRVVRVKGYQSKDEALEGVGRA